MLYLFSPLIHKASPVVGLAASFPDTKSGNRLNLKTQQLEACRLNLATTPEIRSQRYNEPCHFQAGIQVRKQERDDCGSSAAISQP